MKTVILLFILVCPALIRAQSTEKMVIHFEFDKYALRNDAKAVLDSFIALDKTAAPERTIALHGHCDYKGDDAYNDRLSLQRLLAVKSYLEKNNLTSPVFAVEQAHGKRDQLNNSKTPDEQMLNRRVEIIITRTLKPPVENTDQPVKENSIPDKPKVSVAKKPRAISLDQQLDDTAILVGSNIILENIYFVGGRHKFLRNSYPVLENLLNALKRNSSLVIQIEGHICCRHDESDGYDFDTKTGNLSEERAKAVYVYLAAGGISAERLAYKGFGHKRPIHRYPEFSEEERIQNRRVEIKIIRK